MIIQPKDGILISTITLGWSGHGSNVNEGPLHITQSSKICPSPLNAVPVEVPMV